MTLDWRVGISLRFTSHFTIQGCLHADSAEAKEEDKSATDGPKVTDKGQYNEKWALDF